MLVHVSAYIRGEVITWKVYSKHSPIQLTCEQQFNFYYWICEQVESSRYLSVSEQDMTDRQQNIVDNVDTWWKNCEYST